MKGEMDSGMEVREICKRSQEGQGSESSEGGNFDCNICLELAQDPVVTLCGHLFCWPCLYKWFQLHSFPKECPVCKACVDEEKVIPLYGRGKVGAADPRTKMVCIPNRPSGHRPETARPPSLSEPFYQSQQSFNFMSGHGAMPMSSLGNITFSAGFGLFPYLFGFQMHGFADSGYRNASNGLQRGPQTARPEQDQEAFLSRIFLFLGCLVPLIMVTNFTREEGFEIYEDYTNVKLLIHIYIFPNRQIMYTIH